ncbi:unnamed protein product [Lupinus luteus]|uniref:C2 domain-containing protein n=1 Tax=Lupinus luteus TaxID=3873 RepID=A0AAV1Y411_LUPLU
MNRQMNKLMHWQNREEIEYEECDGHLRCLIIPYQGRSSSLAQSSSSCKSSLPDKNPYDKQPTKNRIGHAFRNSWGRKDSEHKSSSKKSTSLSLKTRVMNNNLNPVWNESLMLSIPENIPPLKVLVYDKDAFSTDDYMGEAEIDIQPLVLAAKAYEKSTINESMQLGKCVANKNNTLIRDGVISLDEGKIKQQISVKLQHVERGVLECVPLTQ